MEGANQHIQQYKNISTINDSQAVFALDTYQKLCKSVQDKIKNLTLLLQMSKTLIQQSQEQYSISVKLPIKLPQFQSKLSILLEKKEQNSRKLDQLMRKNWQLKKRMFDEKQATILFSSTNIERLFTNQAYKLAQCKAKIKNLIGQIKQKLYPLHIRVQTQSHRARHPSSISKGQKQQVSTGWLNHESSQLWEDAKKLLQQTEINQLIRSYLCHQTNRHNE